MGQFDDPNVIHLEGVITKSKLPYTRTAKTKLPWTAVDPRSPPIIFSSGRFSGLHAKCYS